MRMKGKDLSSLSTTLKRGFNRLIRFASRSSASARNCPMTREEYEAFIQALLAAELFAPHDFESAVHFEGCLPVEEIASRTVEE